MEALATTLTILPAALYAAYLAWGVAALFDGGPAPSAYWGVGLVGWAVTMALTHTGDGVALLWFATGVSFSLVSAVIRLFD